MVVGQTNPAWDYMGYDLSARKDPSTLPVNDDAALLRQLVSDCSTCVRNRFVMVHLAMNR